MHKARDFPWSWQAYTSLIYYAYLIFSTKATYENLPSDLIQNSECRGNMRHGDMKYTDKHCLLF